MAGRNLKGVLFDLDGVLIDSYDAWYALLNGAARHYGFPDIAEEKFKLIFGQSVQSDIDILFPGMERDDLASYFEEHFFDHIDAFTRIDGANESFTWCRQHRLGIAVVTNTTQILAEEILSHLDLQPDQTVGSSADVPSKPAPDMVINTCRLLDVHPEESVLLGDSDFDSRAAAAAGVTFIGFRRQGTFSIDEHAELGPLLSEEFSLPCEDTE